MKYPKAPKNPPPPPTPPYPRFPVTRESGLVYSYTLEDVLPSYRSAREARAEAVRSVRTQVAAMPGLDLDMEPGRMYVPEYVSRAAVLALLDTLTETGS